MNITTQCPDESHMQSLGRLMADALLPGLVIFLQGELGTGKTTLTRAMIQAMGFEGPIKSPTFTLVEPYEDLKPAVYHFDLYRLVEPEELEWMGFRDYLSTGGICLIEWPEKGQGFLPKADLRIVIEHAKIGRNIEFIAESIEGKQCLAKLVACMESLS